MALIDPETDAETPEGEARDLEPHELRAAVALDRADETLAAPRPYAGGADEWEKLYARSQTVKKPEERMIVKRAPLPAPAAPFDGEAFGEKVVVAVKAFVKKDGDARQEALEKALGAVLKRQAEVINAAWQERVSMLEGRLAQLEGRLAVAESKAAGKRK